MREGFVERRGRVIRFDESVVFRECEGMGRVIEDERQKKGWTLITYYL